MMELKPNVHGPAAKTPVPSKTLGIAIVIFIIVYQVILMWLWITYTSWDWILIRISLSMADAIAYSALSLSLYAYWRFEQSTENEDMEYLHKFVVSMRTSKLDPELVTKSMEFLFAIQENAEDELGEKIPIPVIAKFIGRAQIPMMVKKMKSMSKHIEKGKLSWDDIQEGLK